MLLSLIGDLAIASVFSVYYLVYTTIKMVLNTMELSVSAVFGNLTVSREKQEEKRVFNLLNFAFSAAGAFACTCMAFLYLPFVFVYTKGNTLDVNYMYPAIAYGLVVLAVFFCVTQPYLTLTNAHGYYRETYLQAAICAGIGTALSAGLTFIDFSFVTVGPVFFYVTTFIYRVYVAKKRLSWLSLKNTVRRLIFIVITSAAAMVLSYFCFKNGYPSGWGRWILTALMTAGVSAVILGIYIAIFERDEFGQTIKYIKAIIFRKRRKTNVETDIDIKAK